MAVAVSRAVSQRIAGDRHYLLKQIEAGLVKTIPASIFKISVLVFDQINSSRQGFARDMSNILSA